MTKGEALERLALAIFKGRGPGDPVPGTGGSPKQLVYKDLAILVRF